MPIDWERAAQQGTVAQVMIGVVSLGFTGYVALKGDNSAQIKEMQKQIDRLSKDDQENAVERLKKGGATITKIRH